MSPEGVGTRIQAASRPELAKPVSASSFSGDSANLDLIRAVLCVLGGHLHYFVTRHETELSWHFGQIGVIIFFVHTSFVLMMSLDRTKLAGPPLYWSFYLKRFFRLYPLSIFCVTVAFVLGVTPEPTEPFRHWSLVEYASNLTLTSNLFYITPMVGGLWTLPLEVQMYAALPFLHRIAKQRTVAFLLVCWALSVPLAMLQMRITMRLNVVAFAPCFVAGVISWRLSTLRSRSLPGWLWPFVFVASWGVFLVSSQSRIMYYRWAFALVLGLLIPLFQEISYRPLIKVSHIIAKYSYGIYLTHIALILFCLGLQTTPVVRWLVFVLLMTAVPIALFHGLENPMIRAGQSLSARFFPPSRMPRSVAARSTVSA